jgi:hypothetical protein
MITSSQMEAENVLHSGCHVVKAAIVAVYGALSGVRPAGINSSEILRSFLFHNIIRATGGKSVLRIL